MTWPKRAFGEFAEFRNGLNFGAAARSGDLPVVGVGDFARRKLRSTHGLETIKSPPDLPAHALLAAGDLLFVRSNGNPELVGRCMIVDALNERVSHSGFTIRARVTSAHLDPRWAACFFESGMAREALGLGASGTNISNLSQGILSSIELPVPPLHRQRQFLSVLDRFESRNSTLSALLDAKRDFKRALLHELLTGRRRFAEFAQTGAWTYQPLEALVEPVSRAVEWDDGDTYNLVSLRRRNGGAFFREAKRGSEIATKQLFVVRAGDFLISRMQAVHGALSVIEPHHDGHHVSGMYMVLRPKEPVRLRTEFLHYASHLQEMYRNVLTSCHGVHIEKMTFDPKRFMRTTVLVPPSLEEQDRVVAALRTIDRDIEQYERLRDAYASQKRALMHRLLSGDLPFPAPSAAPELAHA